MRETAKIVRLKLDNTNSNDRGDRDRGVFDCKSTSYKAFRTPWDIIRLSGMREKKTEVMVIHGQ